MIDVDEYIEPDKNRRRLALVAILPAAIVLALLSFSVIFIEDPFEYFFEPYRQYLTTLPPEKLEYELRRMVDSTYVLAWVGAAIGTVAWLTLAVFTFRNALTAWRTERFPISGTRTAFRTRVRKGAAARRWSVFLFCSIPAYAIFLLGVPYYLVWLLAHNPLEGHQGPNPTIERDAKVPPI